MNAQPETRYARNGSMHLAYQVLGGRQQRRRLPGPASNSCQVYADNAHYVK